MQNIEINTTQNVRITYEVAHLGDRAISFLIDFVIIIGGVLLAMLLSNIIMGIGISWLYYALAAPYVAFYSFFWEVAMKGQTPGKKALNLQVVKLNGNEAQKEDYFLRWIFRLLEIYLCLGTIAAIFVITSKKGQRLGDLVGETSVIKVKPSSQMTLLDLQKKYLKEKEYKPKFPQVKKLSEEDLHFIQGVVLRAQKYNNKAHQEVLRDLCYKISERLNILESEIGPDQTKFLITLIRDYVVLTR